ncbi:glycosyltransferase family 2 protein [Oceanibium sediminis]|uniref:glycosyltransferase family 2 protein n=1 Tax=Oceanibium sediminis TaxID=2026339 RepID=UPI0018E59C4B|nr:glycosyltransferase [Oceanibium sediminis]
MKATPTDTDMETGHAAPTAAIPGRVLVGIATTGRPDIAARTVARLARQTRRPERIVVSVPNAADFDASRVDGRIPVEVVLSEKGLTRQRNAILDMAERGDLLLFLDDDFLLDDHYLEEVAALFAAHPDVVMATGLLEADGIRGPGISFEDAEAMIATLPPPPAEQLSTAYSGYGCNMVFRVATAVENGLRFDEKLPLYGWLEDVDFSRRILAHGRVVKSNRLRGVHMGIKSGRQRGIKLGYSQIANPIYLRRGGVISNRTVRIMVRRNLSANLLRSLAPEPWSDRRGRLRGNLLAIWDLMRGRLDPGRILELD